MTPILEGLRTGAWRLVPVGDNRPANCRHRLQEEGKPYPRSSCQACGKGIMTGLGRACTVSASSDATAALLAEIEGLRGALEDARKQVSGLARLLDQQMGTPCEQIRHEQEINKLRAERDEARADYEQASDWNSVVDLSGLDKFDALADQWLAIDAIQRMHNAATSIFSKWSNDELMDRFKLYMTNIMHTAFVEGAIVGVRASEAARATKDRPDV